MEKNCWDVPDFGRVIQRERLTSIFGAQSPELIVISAPSGYGKSVLAAQFARIGGFDTAVWVDLHGQEALGDLVVSAAASALLAASDGTGDAARSVAINSVAGRADTWMLLEECVGNLGGHAVCLVLDNAGALHDLRSVQRLAELLVSATRTSSRVIVTCRQVAGDQTASSRIWTIEAHDLRFRCHEVETLLEVCGAEKLADAARILEQSGGQAALVSLMARHPQDLGEDGCTQDLVWYTKHLLGAMEDSALLTLYGATLLSTGTVEELETVVDASPGTLDLPSLSEVMPLLSIECSPASGQCTFRAHAALQRALRSDGQLALDAQSRSSVRARALNYLAYVRSYDRLARGLLADGCAPEVLEWCEKAGESMLRAVGPGMIRSCLSSIPADMLAYSPRALLLRATVLCQLELRDDALRSATCARSLASHLDDARTDAAASLVIARLAVDAGDFPAARDALAHLDQQRSGAHTRSQECAVQAFLALCDAHRGDIEHAEHRVARVRELLSHIDVGSEEAVFAANSVGGIEGDCCGQWESVARTIGMVARKGSLSPVQRLLVRANHAVALLELGYVSDAEALANDVAHEADRFGLSQLRAYAGFVGAMVLYARGDADSAAAAATAVVRTLSAVGDALGLAGILLQFASCERSAGRFQRSLDLAERAVAASQTEGGDLSLLSVHSGIEQAASLLALGDATGAALRLEEVLGRGLDARLVGQRLKAALLRTLLDQAQGNRLGSEERLREFSAYIASGSANYQLSTYISAFPQLLGALAAAVGTERIPSRLFSLLRAEVAARSAAAAIGSVPPEELALLTIRLESAPSESHGTQCFAVTASSEEHNPPACYVQMLGRFEVQVAGRTIRDAAWRKRKARALLAMLVLDRGRDLPRDVVLERLWPEMDYEHARNNFYVTWSTVKRMLMVPPSQSIHDFTIEHVGGLCRITGDVRTDVDVFRDLRDAARRAADAADLEGLAVCMQGLIDTYQGDLLAGDLYDDWLVSTRNQLRTEFCNALLMAAAANERAGHFRAASELATRASDIDPWREDAYQILMRCHMSSGQRGRAIEAYLSCRERLVEDLGIDPSAETTSIYQSVLVMDHASGASTQHAFD